MSVFWYFVFFFLCQSALLFWFSKLLPRFLLLFLQLLIYLYLFTLLFCYANDCSCFSLFVIFLFFYFRLCIIFVLYCFCFFPFCFIKLLFSFSCCCVSENTYFLSSIKLKGTFWRNSKKEIEARINYINKNLITKLNFKMYFLLGARILSSS